MAVTNPNAAPPAPPAPSLGAQNQQNQGSTVAQAAAGQQSNQEPTATIVKPGDKEKSESNVQNTSSTQPSTTSQPQSGSTSKTGGDKPKFAFSAPPPTPTYDNRPDPRTPEYYANKAALEATFGADLVGLQSEQDAADLRFDQETAIQNEYQRRRRRDLAEARLGTGSAYTGSARRERSENLLDFQIEQARRNLDKSAQDNDRLARLFGLESERNQALLGLDQDFANRLSQSYQEESQTSAGDREYTPDYAGQIRAITNQIQRLQSQLKRANNPQKRARIKGKIDELKKRRSQIQGKAKNSG